MQDLKKHIEFRIRTLKSINNYQIGLISKSEIQNGLYELKLLANALNIEINPALSFNVPEWAK